eukprot:XP_014038453.1 PREDICTED: trinucleotide repeat-containing gene 18 protein-like [Salmo salar]
MSPAALDPLLRISSPPTLSRIERDGESSFKHTHLSHTHTQLHTHPSLTHPQLHTSIATTPQPCPLPHKHTSVSLPTVPQPCPPLPPTQPQEQQTEEEEEEEEEEAGAVKMEVLTYGCRGSYQLPPSVPKVETKPEVTKKSSPVHYPSCTTASSERPTFRPGPDTHASSPPPPLSPCPPPPSPRNVGMMKLWAASQMPQAAPPALPTLLQTEASSLGRDVTSPGCLEVWALEGMTLLSDMASLEMDRIQLEQGEVLSGLDSLLEAGRKVLLEAIESQSHIDLPRRLHPSKTYSWRTRTDPQEQLFSKVCVEVCDGGELQHRIRLAELQRQYKDKQRQLDKLQRRSDTQEVQQEEERRSLTRRGRGRPRKRKRVTTPPGKMESRTGKLGRTVQYSDVGDGGRKRFHCSREEDEMEGGRGGEKRRWQDREPSTSHSLEVFKARRVGLCDHEQLACDLDRALSLSVLSSSSRRLTSDPSGRSDGGGILSSGGKEKIRGERKTVSPPLPHSSSSQRSSFNYNSDSEEDVPRGGCHPFSGLRPHTAPPRKRPSPSSSNQAARERKQKHLSLLLQEAGLSSSDDSFDQGY